MRTMSNSISGFGLIALLVLLPSLASSNEQYVQWGNKMIAAKKYDDAIKYFSGAIKANPKSASAYKGIGYAYVYKGDKAKALQYLNYSLKLNPSDSGLQQYVATLGGGSSAPAAGGSASEQAYQNGVKYMGAKQYQYAAYYFNQATQSDPNSAKAWQGLGNAFFAQGNKAKAISAWEKAVALNPSNTQLANYVTSLKGTATASADSAPSSSADAGPGAKKPGFNPWVMGGTVAALGAIMLFLF